MVAHVIRDLYFLRHSIATRNTRVTAAQRRIIDALTFQQRVRAETITREPIISIACLASSTIGAAPLHGDGVTASVSGGGRVPPVCGRLVVVDAHTTVVATGSRAADLGSG